MRLYQTVAKEELSILCLLFCLVTRKYNVISCSCCCLSSHIIFIHILTIVYLPVHMNSRPLFHVLICHISEAWSEY